MARSLFVNAGVITPDQVSLGVLATAVPRDAVDEAVAVCGVAAQRADGKLPPHVVAYLTMALCLFPEDDYREVATKITGTLDRWGCWNAAWSVPTASAITQARKRLGRQVFPEIFARTCGPVAGPASPVAGALAAGPTRGAWLRGWRVLAIDGFDLDVPDTPENAAEFGYATSDKHRSAYPKARVVAISECGTHAMIAAQVAGFSVGEHTLADRLLPGLQPDELLTADRNFYSYGSWRTAAATGAALVWRAPTQLLLPVVRVLPDGTYLSILVNPRVTTHRERRERLVAAAAWVNGCILIRPSGCG
jgi:transposase IS4-like protein